MKNKLCGIGEALIDFIPEVKGQRLKDVPSFKRVAGGAPANVVGAVTKLGIPSKFLTKLGDDPFGDYIVEVLDEAGIDTSNIARDKEGETALAFVSLASDGNRDFKFYRKNSADLRYSVEDIPADILRLWNDSFLQCRSCGISNEGSSQETDRYGDRAECESIF